MPKNCGKVCFGQHCWPGGEIATMFAPPTEVLVGNAGAAGDGATAGAAHPAAATASSKTSAVLTRQFPRIEGPLRTVKTANSTQLIVRPTEQP
jgi:hypothetical protein